MSKENTDGVDELWETLTLEKEFVNNKAAPSYISRWRYRWYREDSYFEDTYWCHYKRHEKDIEYRNREGKLHRLYGPAYIGVAYKFEEWFKDGVRHRIGGPAVSTSDGQYWIVEGRLHRIDGPAVIKKGHPKEYWIHGHKVSTKEFKKESERRIRRGDKC